MKHTHLITKKLRFFIIGLVFLAAFGSSPLLGEGTGKQEIDLSGPEAALKSAMNRLFSLIDAIEKDKGLSREEKTEKIINTIKNSRWGPEQDNYFWVIDLNGKTIGEPVCSDFEGKSITNYTIIDYKDNPEAKKAFADLINACKKNGESFFQYIAPECRRDPADRKIALARILSTKNWIIITGIYRDTIEAYQAPVETNFFAPADEGPGPIDDSEPASGI